MNSEVKKLVSLKIRRGIAIAVFMIIMIIVLVAVLVPAYFVFESEPSYYQPVQFSGESQQQNYQKQEVFKGEPSIFYNSSENPYPYLSFHYASVPILFNVSEIYYFSPSSASWTVSSRNVIITSNTQLPLPQQAFNDPVLIVTSLGNMFYLNPNTSVSTVSSFGVSGKDPIYILSLGLNGSQVIPLSEKVVFNGQTINTPDILYVNPGTYGISTVSDTVFVDGLTGNFYQWTSVGSGGVSSPNSESTSVSVSGPLVITLEYKMILTKYQVTFKQSGIPYNEVTLPSSGNSITPVNSTIKVAIDNKTYELGQNGLTLCLTYGYHQVQFTNPVNEYFNYTFSNIFSNGEEVPFGEINEYVVSGNETNSNVTVSGEYIFVSGNGYFTEEYQSKEVYYAIVTKNDFYLPPHLVRISNTSPICGNIAGSLLNSSIDGQTIALGPTQNYENQVLYYPNGTSVCIENDYLEGLSGKFDISGYHYLCLSSFPQYFTINGNPIYISSNGKPESYAGFTLDCPVILVNYEEWCYGGVPL